jgi:MFS family permease
MFLVGNRNLWALSAVQFCNNFGWAFLINDFPDYLQLVHNKFGAEKGELASLPLLTGCVGMFLGGFFTDWLIRRFGMRPGRMIPLLIGTLGCSAAYLSCVFSSSAWAIVAAMCAITVLSDLGVPATWAIAQDIAGKRVGPALGWANMWGNFGAACNPLLFGFLQREFGWSAVFKAGVAIYIVSACCTLFIDASRTVDAESAKERDRV